MCPCVCLLNTSKYTHANSKVIAEQYAASMTSAARADAKRISNAKLVSFMSPAVPAAASAAIVAKGGDKPSDPMEPRAKRHKADHASAVDTTLQWI